MFWSRDGEGSQYVYEVIPMIDIDPYETVQNIYNEWKTLSEEKRKPYEAIEAERRDHYTKEKLPVDWRYIFAVIHRRYIQSDTLGFLS